MAPVIAALRAPAGAVRGARLHHRPAPRDARPGAGRCSGSRPDLDLGLMRRDQTLNGLAAAALAAVDGVLAARGPDWLLVQGDTTTAMAAALAAFHRRVRVGHVEAGLRTGDLQRPFPEEANRRIVDLLADALFAPTARCPRYAARRGVRPRARPRGGQHGDRRPAMSLLGRSSLTPQVRRGRRCWSRSTAARASARRWSGSSRRCAGSPSASRRCVWIYPVHRNPNVRGPAHEILGGLPNLELHEPFDYRELVRRLARCRFVLTDSGGIQEEAPTFGKPVLVLRETTERPEGVEAGVARLVGTDRRAIFAEAARAAAPREPLTAPWRARSTPTATAAPRERIAAILAGEPWTPFRPAGSRGQWMPVGGRAISWGRHGRSGAALHRRILRLRQRRRRGHPRRACSPVARPASGDLEVTVASGDPPRLHGSPRRARRGPGGDLPAVADDIRESGLVILGGGGLFQDYWDVPLAAASSRPASGGLPFYAGFACSPP